MVKIHGDQRSDEGKVFFFSFLSIPLLFFRPTNFAKLPSHWSWGILLYQRTVINFQAQATISCFYLEAGMKLGFLHLHTTYNPCWAISLVPCYMYLSSQWYRLRISSLKFSESEVFQFEVFCSVYGLFTLTFLVENPCLKIQNLKYPRIQTVLTLCWHISQHSGFVILVWSWLNPH